ncbi:hypothetical protein PV417_26395 [Streptomyces sp. ME19-03-3]|nr:hypothetical protein [Streptomyces sp. ME19-03-3]
MPTGDRRDHATTGAAHRHNSTGVWPRAAALVLRLALEEGLRQYWRTVRPE